MAHLRFHIRFPEDKSKSRSSIRSDANIISSPMSGEPMFARRLDGPMWNSPGHAEIERALAGLERKAASSIRLN